MALFIVEIGGGGEGDHWDHLFPVEAESKEAIELRILEEGELWKAWRARRPKFPDHQNTKMFGKQYEEWDAWTREEPKTPIYNDLDCGDWRNIYSLEEWINKNKLEIK